MTFSGRRNVITSDEGFTVTVGKGLEPIRYEESGRTAEIDYEISGSIRSIVIYTGSITWTGPDGKVHVTAEERARIIERLRRAFAFHRYRLETIESPF